jgi:hypothetical protein
MFHELSIVILQFRKLYAVKSLNIFITKPSAPSSIHFLQQFYIEIQLLVHVTTVLTSPGLIAGKQRYSCLRVITHFTNVSSCGASLTS